MYKDFTFVWGMPRKVTFSRIMILKYVNDVGGSLAGEEINWKINNEKKKKKKKKICLYIVIY